jgi:hypothetical protein
MGSGKTCDKFLSFQLFIRVCAILSQRGNNVSQLQHLGIMYTKSGKNRKSNQEGLSIRD